MSKIVHRPEKTELEHAYLVDKKASHALAEQYDCSSPTVLGWLHDYKIPLRKPGGQRISGLLPPKTRNRINITHVNRRSTCNILKDHAEDLKDDPERLSTEFLQRIIGVKC